MFASVEVFPASSVAKNSSICWGILPRQAGDFSIIIIIGQNHIHDNLRKSPLQSAIRENPHQEKF
jgi:hypothetical protein